MISHYETYKHKDPSEIVDLLQMAPELTYESKLALQKIIDEKYQDQFTGGVAYKKLINSIEEDQQEIEDLIPLKKVGLQLFDDRDGLKLKNHRSGVFRDVFSLILGIALMLLIIPTVMSIVNIQKNGIAFMSAVTLMLLAVGTLAGLGLVVRAINRMVFFKSFELIKNDSISCQKRESFSLVKNEFNSDMQLQLLTDYGKCAIVCKNTHESHEILAIEDPDFKLKKTLEKVCQRFNEYH